MMNKDEAVQMLNIMMLKFVPVDQYGDLEDTEPYEEAVGIAIDAIREVQKHEETFEWCTGCKEYDHEDHCCHRWTKCIRNTIAEFEEEHGIVRCKDCRHADDDETVTSDTTLCKEYMSIVSIYGYCSMGEERKP